MKKIIAGLIILVVLIAVYIAVKNWMKPIAIEKPCPSEKIIDKMPGPYQVMTEYYIVNGKRVEIDAYPNNWVETNCQVRVTEAQ